MTREGVEIYREVFTLEKGRDRVLTAWDEKSQVRDFPDPLEEWVFLGDPLAQIRSKRSGTR